ncbi:MAG: bifunctional adenosylcobinamide kinase/adenosylcobinamide-phosphate guanylyltransferase [Clostridia bacterium]|nr:bifunctional adenosylcobinamide kinase/adenosylcobinamide-phosphate guanylyltransferase [Clostridia bacterium]
MITLVTGGARSGKSAYAEKLIEDKFPGQPVLYIATASNTDGEMDSRIAIHRARRPENWRTAERWKFLDHISMGEEPAVMLDCMGFMLDNAFFEYIEDWDNPEEYDAERAEELVKDEISRLASLCNAMGKDLVLVTNEVGDGLVPATKVSRLYRDALGRFNCHVAALADHVALVVCGIAVNIK